MHKAIVSITTFCKDFAYGIHAGNAIRHGLEVPAQRTADNHRDEAAELRTETREEVVR